MLILYILVALTSAAGSTVFFWPMFGLTSLAAAPFVASAAALGLAAIIVSLAGPEQEVARAEEHLNGLKSLLKEGRRSATESRPSSSDRAA
jgi:hypothetical protein